VSRGDKVKKLVLGREVPEFKDLENSQSMNFAKKKRGGGYVPKYGQKNHLINRLCM